MRPLTSYEDDGRDAYLDGVEARRNPHPESTLRYHQWAAGWFRASAEDVYAHEDDGDPLEPGPLELAREDAEAASRAAQRLLSRAERLTPAVEALEAHAGPAATWKANCYGVAERLLASGLLAPMEAEFGEARLLYGAYDGFVSRDSLFFGRGAFHRHAWIEFESGLVVDPTLWVFLGSEPAVAAATVEDYDLAHRRMRRDAGLDRDPPPPFDPSARSVVFDANDPEAVAAVHALLGAQSRMDGDRRLSIQQAFWLGKQPISRFGDAARSVYLTLIRNGLAALIPIDNRTAAGVREACETSGPVP